MWHFYLLLTLLALLDQSAAAQPGRSHSPALFPFTEHGRWGFLDSTGAVVVAARFAQVQPFVEGLAPVRQGGRYGYVDATGHLVLPAAYDYATPFHEGLALVLQNRVPHLITRTGHRVPLPAAYKSLECQPGLDHSGVWLGYLPGSVKPKKQGGYQVLNTHGQRLSPEVFSQVGPLSNHRLVAYRLQRVLTPTDSVWQTQACVFDEHGRLVVPYRRFGAVSPFQEGLALAAAYWPDSSNLVSQCLLDTAGQVVAQLPPNLGAVLWSTTLSEWVVIKSSQGEVTDYYSQPLMADGVLRVRIGRPGQLPTSDSCELGTVDRQGRLVQRFPGVKSLSPFRHGRAWAADAQGNQYLVDQAGRRLNTATISEPLLPEMEQGESTTRLGPVFVNCLHPVLLRHELAVVDSTGRVVRSQETESLDEHFERLGGVLTFQEYNGHEGRDSVGLYIWPTGLRIPPRFTFVDNAGYQHGLLAVVENNHLGYLSPAGRYVWRADTASHGPLNVDYLRRSFYEVASTHRLEKYAGSGGWYESKNKPTQTDATSFAPHKLALQVAPAATPNALAPAFDGHRVTLANTTTDTAVFDAQDSGLYLMVQARNGRGQWRNIEYMPSSFCGNSYHRVFLAPGQYWQLVVPAYVGGRKTQLRLKLIRRRDNDPKQQVVLYSNTFAGSVNPAQFWRPQPSEREPGLMNPYTN